MYLYENTLPYNVFVFFGLGTIITNQYLISISVKLDPNFCFLLVLFLDYILLCYSYTVISTQKYKHIKVINKRKKERKKEKHLKDTKINFSLFPYNRRLHCFVCFIILLFHSKTCN